MFRYIVATKVIAPRLKIRQDNNEQTCYDCNEECLIIGNDFNKDEFGFMRHLREQHQCEYTDCFKLSLWTILHEIGHYKTLDMIENDDLASRALCAIVDEEVARTNKTVQDMYFNIESEWEATEWAVSYIKSHPLKAKFLNLIMG